MVTEIKQGVVHVDDVCRVLIKGAESKYSYKIFNLGSKNYISIKQLAKKISKNIKYIQKKGDIKHSRS